MRTSAKGVLARVLFLPALLLITAYVTHTAAQPIAATRAALAKVPTGEVIVGIASFYDEAGPTASGEIYDPTAFTAAALTELRDKFGGIKFGRLYRPVYALAEFAGKRAILKFNDVGPLRPGRKFDLSRAAMAHFGGIEKGVLADFKITLLPIGQDFATGPVLDEPIETADIDAPPTDGLQEATIAALTAEAEPATVTLASATLGANGATASAR